jgi:fucose permease
MNRRRLFFSACGGMFVFGVVLVLLGTLFGLPAMRESLGLNTLVRQGDLQTVLLFGVLFSSLIAGPLIDRFGHRMVLALSSFLVAVPLATISFASGYSAAQILSFAIGLGGGGLNMATNVLVSDIYADDRGGKLNQLGMFFGVGAVFLPFATAWMATSIHELMVVAAMLSASCGIVYLLLKFPDAREPGGASLRDFANTLRYPGVLFFGFLLFFESGNESAMTGWTSTWATNLGAGVRTATLVLALFQGMMMLGRLLAAPVLRHVTKLQLVVGSVIGGVISIVLVMAAHSVTALAIGAGLAGLTFASVYPTLLALAGDRYQRHAGTVFGILFTVGLSGAMVYPWLIGRVSQSYGLRAGIYFPLVGTAAITAMVLVLRAKYPPSQEH